MTKNTKQYGFTLIETLVAMTIFSIGILSLYVMLTAAIKENATANRITTAATWAQDGVEKLLATKYEDLTDGDGANDGCAGLGDWPNSDDSTTEANKYTIYWNIANNCSLTKLNEYFTNPANVDQHQMPIHIRVIVTQKVAGNEKVFSVFNYIKKNYIK